MREGCQAGPRGACTRRQGDSELELSGQLMGGELGGVSLVPCAPCGLANVNNCAGSRGMEAVARYPAPGPGKQGRCSVALACDSPGREAAGVWT